MPPQAISLALFVVQEAIKYSPEIAAAVSKLFTKTDPTAADWDALRADIAALDYDAIVHPASATGASASDIGG